MLLKTRTTIASYPGGKSDQKKHEKLFSAVPRKISYLIEPFSGLANFFLVISPRVEKAWLNDKDPEIYAILKCIQDKDLLTKLIEYIKSVYPIERDDYYHWKQYSPNELLEKAVRRLIILNCSPNGAGGGYSKEKAHRKWYINKPKVWLKINEIFNEKQVKITNYDYKEVFRDLQNSQEGKDRFWYLDPPYHKVAKKGSLYAKGYNLIDWNELKEFLANLQDHWILSNRDNVEMRNLFGEFHLKQYNTYNDMNNTKNNNPELIISNRRFTAVKSTVRTLDNWFH